MSSARYWRVVGIESWAPTGPLDLTAATLCNASGASVDGAAAVTANIAPVAGDVAQLPAGGASTSWPLSAVRSGGWALHWDCGAPTAVAGVRFAGPLRDSFVHSARLEYLDGGMWQAELDLVGVAWPGPGLLSAMQGDPDFDKTALLIPGTSSTADVSLSPSPVTVLGAVTVAATDQALRGPALYYPGSPSALSVAHKAAFDLGSADWAFEARVIFAAPPTSSRWDALLTKRAMDSSPPTWLQIYRDGGGHGIGKLVANVHTGGGTWDVTLVSADRLLASVPYQIKLARTGGTVRLWVNSELQASATISGTVSANTTPIILGGAGADIGAPFAGWIEQVRLSAGTSRGATQLRQTLPWPAAAGVEASYRYLAEASSKRTAFSSALSRPGTPVAAGMNARDMEFGGTGTLEIDTSIKGDPANTPTRARVSILRQRDKALARVAWSGADGKLSVPGLDLKNQQFVALAEYPGNPADPTAEGYMRPVAGVSRLESP